MNHVLPNPTIPPDAEPRKLIAALHRAIPVTRMVDCGVPLGDALNVHRRTAHDDLPPWDEVCEELARRHVAVAEEAALAGSRLTASQAWRAASALLQCGQLAFNADIARKKAMYEQAHAALECHARLGDDLAAFTRQTPHGPLHGWLVRPATMPAKGAVIVVGGLSGWGASYLDMGRALAARGLLAILAEGPGQGLTRMRSGMHLRPETLPLMGEFLSHAQSLSASRLGIWGNSFGGLLAAGLAAVDQRVQAVCINGAPLTPGVPPFRTAREQMEAVFGTTGEQELSERLGMLGLDPRRHRIAAAMLVVEGGRDPIVPLGEQKSFFALAEPGRTRLLTWEDGEHTIYNHAEERNALVADWFAQQLIESEV